MGMRVIYKCDICREDVKDLNMLLGLHFKDMKNFSIGNYGCTEGVHICYGCAKQLLNELSKITELTDEL
jgi:hypothetical protein